MESLAARIGTKTLRDLIIPGAHDAATAGISASSELDPQADVPGWVHLLPQPVSGPTISAWSRAQGMSLTQQLRAGIRYLDLRVAKRQVDGQLHFVHSLYGGPVLPGIDEIAVFLHDHPKEIVILDFQHFYGMTMDDHTKFAAVLEEKFGSIFVKPPEGKVFPTLDTLWSEKRQVVVLYSDDSGGGPILKGHHSFWPHTQIQSHWRGISDITELHGFLDQDLASPPPDQLFVLQGVLTPDSAMILRGLAGPLLIPPPADLFHTIVTIVTPSTFPIQGPLGKVLKPHSSNQPESPLDTFLRKFSDPAPIVVHVPVIGPLIVRPQIGTLPFVFGVQPPRSLQELAAIYDATIINWFTNDWRRRHPNILIIDWVENGDFVGRVIDMN